MRGSFALFPVGAGVRQASSDFLSGALLQPPSGLDLPLPLGVSSGPASWAPASSVGTGAVCLARVRRGEVGAAPAQPRPSPQLRGRCRGTPQGRRPGAPALEGLPRLPHRQLQGGGAAGGPRDGEPAGSTQGGVHPGWSGDCRVIWAPLRQGEPATWMTFLISYWGEQIGQKIRKITDW